MPQPLVMRRAGEFERMMFVVSIVLGFIAVFTPLEVSSALEKTWPNGALFMFGTMALGGIGGLWVTRGEFTKTRLDVGIEETRLECVAECYALAIVGLTWLGYSLTALVTSGGAAVAAGGITIAVPLAAFWRIHTVLSDLRRVRKALENPQAVQFEALADPEDGGEG